MPTALIVEDDVEIAQVLGSMLELMDWKSRHASNARVAIEHLSKDVPDLVLLDLYMPIASGVEVCQAMRRDPRTRQVPAIMISADGMTQSQDAARMAGVTEYLVKPISFDELQAAIKRVVISAGS
jgi:CheY-like chemotaxis protein